VSYWYFGIERVVLRKIARRAAVLAFTTGIALVSVTATGSSHVAAWIGVSTPDAQAWLQAGIAKTAGQRPAEYIEVGRGGRQISLHLWPTRLGHRARVRLLRRGDLWQVRIDGHVSRWTRIPHGKVNTLSLLEVYRDGGRASGVAVVGGRRVRGG